jgi:phage portal protein BeeE
LVRLRPDWVSIVGKPRYVNGGQVGWTKIGYLYTEGGAATQNERKGDGVPFLVNEVAHFAPIPDPLATFTGMSWLTPVIREIQADQSMTRHQRKFFDNGATPNMVIKHIAGATEEKVKAWLETFEDKHVGVENAYKTLQLYPGADATVIGSDMEQVDFKVVRGAGETRIAAAAGTPPIIVGLSEGLAAATYSNYGQARRRFADGTMHPLWQNVAGSIENIVPAPSSSSRLWYDSKDIPFLREDEADAANIAAVQAATINTYITAGFEPDSVIKAVTAGDLGLLVDSGLRSVQLMPAGSSPTPTLPKSETNNAPPLALIRRNSDGSTSLESATAR